jgi:hypothetical protein
MCRTQVVAPSTSLLVSDLYYLEAFTKVRAYWESLKKMGTVLRVNVRIFF